LCRVIEFKMGKLQGAAFSIAHAHCLPRICKIG
jgi:hypothetical protein